MTTLSEIGKINDFMKWMEVFLHRHHFNGEYPVSVLYFLACFTRNDNIQKTSKVQVYLTLLSLLDGFDLS